MLVTIGKHPVKDIYDQSEQLQYNVPIYKHMLLIGAVHYYRILGFTVSLFKKCDCRNGKF